MASIAAWVAVNVFLSMVFPLRPVVVVYRGVSVVYAIRRNTPRHYPLHLGIFGPGGVNGASIPNFTQVWTRARIT